MKTPKLNELQIDAKGTRIIRNQMKKSKKIKITINLDSDLLNSVREIAAKQGTPYQSLVNRLLKQALEKKTKEESRLDRLEKELEKLKEKVA